LYRNPLDFFSDTIKRYGDRVELRVLGRRSLLLANPADADDVLIGTPQISHDPLKCKACGRSLGMLFIRVKANADEGRSGLLAVMLSRFRFGLKPGTKIEPDAWLTLRPKNGFSVVVSAR
jgi:hypothetical protein